MRETSRNFVRKVSSYEGAAQASTSPAPRSMPLKRSVRQLGRTLMPRNHKPATMYSSRMRSAPVNAMLGVQIPQSSHDSSSGLNTPEPRGPDTSTQDERMRMREDARRQASQAPTGLLAAQSEANDSSTDNMRGPAIVRASFLFQGTLNQQRKRRVRPFEPYVPPARKNPQQRPGLATRLLSSSQSSSADSESQESVPDQAVPYAVRCLSEPCSVVMSESPEETPAAQYVHVRPVCQHAAWNLSASSVLGQYSKDQLVKVVEAIHSTLGIDSSKAAASGTDSEINSHSRSAASSNHSIEESTSSQGRGKRTRRAKGKAQHSHCPDTSIGNEDATLPLATPAGAKKWACWKQAVGAAQAMYAQQFIEAHGHPPQVLPKQNMPQLRSQQSTHQDSDLVEHMLNAFYESRSWQHVESSAKAFIQRRQSAEHAPQQFSWAGTLDTHEHTERYEQHSMSVWESSSHHEELEHDAADQQGDRWVDEQEQDVQHTAGTPPVPRSQSLDLNRLDMLWNQATTKKVTNLESSEEASGAESLLESSSDVEHSVAAGEIGHSRGHFMEEGAQQGTLDNLVAPPEWGSFQPRSVQQMEAVTHASHASDEQLLEESPASVMQGSSRVHDEHIVDDHDEYDDDDDEAVFYDQEEYTQILHGIAMADDPLDLDRMVGNLPPSIDGLGMLPHDLGFDGLHSSHGGAGDAGPLGAEDYRLGGAAYGGTPSRRSFNFLR